MRWRSSSEMPCAQAKGVKANKNKAISRAEKMFFIGQKIGMEERLARLRQTAGNRKHA